MNRILFVSFISADNKQMQRLIFGQVRRPSIYSGSNTDGSFTTAISTSFLKT